MKKMKFTVLLLCGALLLGSCGTMNNKAKGGIIGGGFISYQSIDHFSMRINDLKFRPRFRYILIFIYDICFLIEIFADFV